ncbi:thioesterase family protein [Snodgrassella sp. CFCC 13594]|uniref:acyl-CoA thioesterase n=1 Tax=Snodgrassella sp. CFCC 13594 TaxID=1775559 RepID=UPI0018D3C12D|nr:thioesterase family protein [Snodgrassella sp. CFCC 13594]
MNSVSLPLTAKAGMPKRFQQPWVVVSEDLDDMHHVNNVCYLQRLQDVAVAHWLAVTTPALRAAYVWVARRHVLDYLVPAFLGDDLWVETQVSRCHGAVCSRDYRVTRSGDGKTVLVAQTEWCLLDKQSLRPKRIPESIVNLFFQASLIQVDD